MKSSAAFKLDDFDSRDTEEASQYSFVPISKKENPSHNISNENQFEVLPIVKEYNRIKEFEEDKKQRKIQDAVKDTVKSIEKEVREKGYKDGFEKGKDEALENNQEILEEKMENLTSMIKEIASLKQNILSTQKKEIYELINVLVRWIVLKELSQDDQYIERLLERLILELHERDNLLIRINKKEYDRMPEVLKIMEEKVGDLTNVRIRIEQSDDFSGIILESENGIMDGSLDQQLKNLDKIFSF